jgi:apolipoprotein N-acyltransferase
MLRSAPVMGYNPLILTSTRLSGRGASNLPAHRTTLSLRGSLILCALSGLLLSLCFPPAGFWFLAWVALVPWLIGLRLGRGWAALAASWAGGVVFFAALLYWLYLFGLSVWLLAAALLGLWLALWGIFVRWIGRLGPLPRMVGAAVLWSAVEWLRGLGEFGFTWGWLGYSQSPLLALLPIARLVGTLGLSFLIALVNAALAEMVIGMVRGEPVRSLALVAAGCGLAAACLLGARAWVKRLPGPGGPEIRAAVIQGSAHGPLLAKDVNVPLTAREQQQTLDIYQSLTLKAAAQRPALVVWPESTIPGLPEAEPWIAGRLAEIARASNAWLLAGGPYRDQRGRSYNSAYLYSPTGNLTARYDKVQLVPFGEYVPGRSWLPFLSRYHVRDFDFTPGPVPRVLQAGTIAVGPMICFESTFPNLAWPLVRRRAQVLVIMTNDAWFGRTAAAAQHQQIAVLRAVETGRWVLRGASTGISSIIAPDGKVVASAGLFQRKVLSAKIRLVQSDRPDPRWGLAFAWLMVALSIAYIILPAAPPRGRGRAPSVRPSAGPRRRGPAAPR